MNLWSQCLIRMHLLWTHFEQKKELACLTPIHCCKIMAIPKKRVYKCLRSNAFPDLKIQNTAFGIDKDYERKQQDVQTENSTHCLSVFVKEMHIICIQSHYIYCDDKMKSQHAFNVYLLLTTCLLLDVAHSAPSHCKCSEYVQDIHIATSERRLILRKKPCLLGRAISTSYAICPIQTIEVLSYFTTRCLIQIQPERSVDMFDGDDTIYFNKVQKCQPVDCRKLL
ncbi:hypothetical protein MAR_028862 [Mya arenaria]|uniref:Uncharacterized protein n=1 Tax=Mya arenaria TaxID=6604 RepID=A0ABY7DET4_MYAAR|nr:hypothetical protein MAR_028862 [Mya arenaria]